MWLRKLEPTIMRLYNHKKQATNTKIKLTHDDHNRTFHIICTQIVMLCGTIQGCGTTQVNTVLVLNMSTCKSNVHNVSRSKSN